MKKNVLTKQILLALAAAAMLPAGQAGAETLTLTDETAINVSSGEKPEYKMDDDVTYTGNSTWLTNTGGEVTVNDEEPANSLSVHGAGNGIYNANNGKTSITANGGITLQATGTGSGDTSGILNEEEAASGMSNRIEICSKGAVKIEASHDKGQSVNGITSTIVSTTVENVQNITEITGSSVTVSSTGNGDSDSGALYLKSTAWQLGTLKNKVTITGTGSDDNLISSDTKGVVISANLGEAAVEVTSKGEGADNILKAKDLAMELIAGNVKFMAEKGNNYIEANTALQRNDGGAIHTDGSYVELTAKNNTIISHNMGGIWGSSSEQAANPDQEQENRKTILTATAGDNTITATNEESATDIITLHAIDNYAIELSAEQGNNVITQIDEPLYGDSSSVVMVRSGKITLEAHGKTEGTGTNIIRSDKEGTEHHKIDVLYAEGAKDASGSIALNADADNQLYGSMTAQVDGSITLTGTNNYIQTATIYNDYLGGTGPTVRDSGYHYAVRAIGGIDSAQEDSQIQITANGGVNQIISEGNVWAEEVNSERAVFATEGGSVSIDGTSVITAGAWADNNAEVYQANNKSASLIAGTFDENKAVTNDEGIIFDLEAMGEENVSSIALNYGAGSAVTGDIVAGYGGKISVTEQAGTSGISTMADGPAMTLRGNALAANGGQIDLALGANSYWEGRADDYQDAASADWRDTHANVYKPIFSQTENENENPIQMNGTVNVSLGQNATWDVKGQSWVSNLSGNGTIILADKETGGYALHIGNLTGENTFVMNVSRDEGDMLYVKDGTEAGQQHLVINNAEEVLSELGEGERVRFATVGDAGDENFDGAHVSVAGEGTFGRSTRIEGEGAFNVNFDVAYVDYDAASEQDAGENNKYNGGAGTDTDGNKVFEGQKPGTTYVDEMYGSEETAQNVYLVRRASTMEDLSHAGQTILSMSKVNYSNAVYMDRLNKRMGEARYIDGDDGLWVRMRHDRIGKEDAFRSMNTMFELGYDWHAKGQKDGEHRQGVAFDYMRGTADYQNVIGDGDVRRAGVWLYDTWLGDKGHYSDYVVKYGRLSNDFDIYGELGDKISGDYDNDVWSVSAEYGRKKDIGNDWYFEPQVQAQYAYVTSADYTTSQGTKVELDGIDSLIGRAGFRLGRDTSEGNTVYFKADILHEFLGDQSIRATDITGTLSTTYENEGTWYDVGFGFSHRMGEDSYMFLDVEHSFGNDNDDTYQVNIGLNRAF